MILVSELEFLTLIAFVSKNTFNILVHRFKYKLSVWHYQEIKVIESWAFGLEIQFECHFNVFDGVFDGIHRCSSFSPKDMKDSMS